MNYKLSIALIVLSLITYFSVKSRNKNHTKEEAEKLELSMRLGKGIYENILLDQKEGIIDFKKVDSIFEIRNREMVKKISE